MTQAAGTALITGGSSRIGGAIARDLAAHGWTVVLHVHHGLERAEALKQSILLDGGKAHVLKADLTRAEDLAGLIPAALKAAGQLDLLVNNASIFQPDEAGALDPALFDAHFAIHVKAPLFLTDAFAGALPAGKEGLVVNIIDQRVWKTTPRFVSYSLSKAALWEQTRMMAQALAPRIRVNAIGPGPSFRNERQTEEDFARQQRAVLLQRGPAPDEFGATVRHFWAMRSITGQMLALDGGQHLAWETADVIGVGE